MNLRRFLNSIGGESSGYYYSCFNASRQQELADVFFCSNGLVKLSLCGEVLEHYVAGAFYGGVRRYAVSFVPGAKIPIDTYDIIDGVMTKTNIKTGQKTLTLPGTFAMPPDVLDLANSFGRDILRWSPKTQGAVFEYMKLPHERPTYEI